MRLYREADPGPREVEDRGLLSEIVDLHDRSGQTYGSAAHATLRRRGILLYHPERDDAEATDRVTEDLLRVLGLPPDQAHEICQRPLPALDGRP